MKPGRFKTLTAPANNLYPVPIAARDLRYCYTATTNRLQFLRSGATNCSTGSATTAFHFDDQGNIKTKNGRNYTFTFDNRLREVSESGAVKEKYRYDANGRRVTAESPTLGLIRSYYNKGGQLSFQADGRTGKNLGSPVAVTNASRSIIETSKYEPYGSVINRALRDGHGFTGHIEDAQTGLNYMHQRYYDPVIGAFLSVDPVIVNSSTGANFNRYWYANNNPYRFVDPDGRAARDLCNIECPSPLMSQGAWPVTTKATLRHIQNLESEEVCGEMLMRV